MSLEYLLMNYLKKKTNWYYFYDKYTIFLKKIVKFLKIFLNHCRHSLTFLNCSLILLLEPLKLSPAKPDCLLVSSLYYNDGWVGWWGRANTTENM